MPGTIAASRSRGHANSGFSNRGQLGLLQRTHCSTARAELNAIARSGKLTYQGWETDMRKAYVPQLSFVAALPDLKKPLRRERLAREKPKLVAGFVSAMERKQKLGWRDVVRCNWAGAAHKNRPGGSSTLRACSRRRP